MRIKCELRITDEYGSDLRSYDHYLSSSENKATLFNCWYAASTDKELLKQSYYYKAINPDTDLCTFTKVLICSFLYTAAVTELVMKDVVTQDLLIRNYLYRPTTSFRDISLIFDQTD